MHIIDHCNLILALSSHHAEEIHNLNIKKSHLRKDYERNDMHHGFFSDRKHIHLDRSTIKEQAEYCYVSF